MSCWRIVRVPQNLCLIPLPGVRSMLLFFGIAVWTLLQATPLTRSMESSPKPGQGLSVSAFKGCSSALNASCSEVAGSHILLSNYVTHVLSRGPGILSSFYHPSWVVSLVLQNLIGLRGAPADIRRAFFMVLDALFLLASASCCVISWLSFQGLGWGVLFFRPGLRGEESGPLLPCSSVCGLHCTGPTKRETIAMGDCYILCGQSGVTWPLGCASSAMRAVPFLPQGVARRSYRRPLSPSGSRCRCHGCPSSRFRNGLFCVPWAQCARAVAPSLLCEELCCHHGGRVRMWHSHSSLRAAT